MGEVVDGEFQKYSTEAAPTSASTSSANTRRLLKLVKHLSDEELTQAALGGHDPEKVYAAYRAR
jgi:pyruvate dehydrogenase E1 component